MVALQQRVMLTIITPSKRYQPRGLPVGFLRHVYMNHTPTCGKMSEVGAERPQTAEHGIPGSLKFKLSVETYCTRLGSTCFYHLEHVRSECLHILSLGCKIPETRSEFFLGVVFPLIIRTEDATIYRSSSLLLLPFYLALCSALYHVFQQIWHFCAVKRPAYIDIDADEERDEVPNLRDTDIDDSVQHGYGGYTRMLNAMRLAGNVCLLGLSTTTLWLELKSSTTANHDRYQLVWSPAFYQWLSLVSPCCMDAYIRLSWTIPRKSPLYDVFSQCICRKTRICEV